MTDAARVTAIVEDLDQALRGPLGVRRVDRVEDLVAAGTFARYLREPRLTLALHFDITPQFLVLDPLLGTLGIVELVMPTADPAVDIGKAVRRHVDRATYLRHLLLRDGSRGQRRPLSVELVLLTADPDSGEKGTLEPIGDALRRVLQDTNSLFHVGVSVLCHGGPEKRFNGRLRRAFPWLLTASRRWLASSRANPDNGQSPDGRSLRRLKLTNYRLPGVREISLSDARIHLMHGPNGSGKSSIAEALEIATCGTIERLVKAGAEGYDEVIRHSKSTAPATLQLGWMIGKENRIQDDKLHTIAADGLKEPLDKTVDVASFRLDQPLMDRLIGHSSHERAKLYMDAFFPKASSSRSDYEQAATAHQLALEKLGGVLERLTTARQKLAELKDHTAAVASPTADPFPTVLNKWLEQATLVELLQRQRIVVATVEAAQRAGWSAVDDAGSTAVSALIGASDVAKLERLEQEGKSAVDALQAQLASFKATTPTSASTAPRVSRQAVESLNAVCPFLFTTDHLESYGRFGDKVAAVINASDLPTYGPIVIGSDKWAEPVLKDLDALIEACKALRIDEGVPATWPGKGGCPEYDDARRTHDARHKAGEELTRNFIERLRPEDGVQGEFDGSLIAAINEVMSLFTPARWAYPDILLPSKFEGDRLGVAMHLDSGRDAIRAEVHLNTAELNLFTVALFMLCVGCVKKPLNLLILDDPLQNMDELTSTALARGIAKIVRLWADLGRREELLILFHGYSDLDRFSAEVAAANYRLPWLSPSDEPASSPPVAAAGQGGDVLAVQKIDGMSPSVTE